MDSLVGGNNNFLEKTNDSLNAGSPDIGHKARQTDRQTDART